MSLNTYAIKAIFMSPATPCAQQP